MKVRGLLKNNTVVGTVMTNLGFTKFCSDNGINFIHTKVGDRFVLEEMLTGGYSLGGEQSGHIIFSDISKAGDGQLTALQVLSLIKRSGRPLSELASVMTVYPQITVNIKADTEAKRRFYTEPAVSSIIKNASSELSGNGRLIVRPSGTEPLIRITVEGTDVAHIRKISEDVACQLKEILIIN
jgi:phosphoglucosamine mutase